MNSNKSRKSRPQNIVLDLETKTLELEKLSNALGDKGFDLLQIPFPDGTLPPVPWPRRRLVKDALLSDYRLLVLVIAVVLWFDCNRDKRYVEAAFWATTKFPYWSDQERKAWYEFLGISDIEKIGVEL